VLAEPPLDGVVLSDGAGLPVSDGDGEGDVVVVVGLLVVGAGVDESIGESGDTVDVLNGAAVRGVHDVEGLGELGAEGRDDRDACPSVVP
jgi:hypothetical protein